MEFIEITQSRHSVRTYEPGVEISEAELKAIFAQVLLSPSSFNMQHWKFFVVRDPARKTALRAFSFGQAQVEQCAAAVVVCGRLNAYEDASEIYRDDPVEMRDKYVPMIRAIYADQPMLQREEAVRSGALAAMSLMYAAKDAGWDSGPMIGFEADKVGAWLHLDEYTVPVMMVVIGKAAGGRQPPRAYRRPMTEVVWLESAEGQPLG